jgi:hypothetical protein
MTHKNSTGWVPWDDSLKDEDDVRRLAVNDLHNELLIASVEIGGICGMASWASAGLAARVQKTGKGLYDISVGELIGLIKEQDGMHAEVERLAIGKNFFSLAREDLYTDKEVDV